MTGRPYGRLPRAVYPYIINCYEEIKALPIRESPYRVLGRMFGVSHQRIQQVVLDERKRLEKEADLGKPEPVSPPQDSNRPTTAGDTSGSVVPWDQD